MLNLRKFALRVLVLAVATSVLTALFAAAALAPSAVIWLLLLPSLWAGYLLADSFLIANWRKALSRAWVAAELNLGTFSQAVLTLPVLPKATLAAMLRVLPVAPALRDCELPRAGRAALAAFNDWRWTEGAAAALLPSAMLGLFASGAAILLLPIAPGGRASTAVLCLLAILLATAVLIRLGLPALHRRRLVRALAPLTPEARRALSGLARGLDWSGTPAIRRDRLLRVLDVGVPLQRGARRRSRAKGRLARSEAAASRCIDLSHGT